MSSKAQGALVADQFGPRAEAYVTSAVHAQGGDLVQLAGLVEGHGDWGTLDLGCGGGHVSFAMAPHVREVVAYDLSPDMLRAVERVAAERGLGNLTTQQGAVEKLPFADHSFDFVVTRFSAHHWQDFQTGLNEARRVLKDRGSAVFIDVVAPASAVLDTYLQSVELLRDLSHVRDYSEAEWRDAARQAGFAPGAVTMRRLRMDFPVWIARMRTSPLHADAIHSLQAAMADEVTRHFEIEPDGSFTIDSMTMLATAG